MAINIFQPDSTLDTRVEAHINSSIDSTIKKWALLGSWLLISVIFGFMISTIWDLNGKIYEVAGKQTVQYDVIDELKSQIVKLEDSKSSLEAENFRLQKEVLDTTKKLRDTEHSMKVEMLKRQQNGGSKK